MPIPFWIHCNVCAARMGNSTLYMLSCSHTICKNCMSNSNKGTQCPSCKKSIKHVKMTELSDKQKSFFKPDIVNNLDFPLQQMQFQQKQQMNLFQLSVQMKLKREKALQLKTKLEEEVKLALKEHEKLRDRRKQMQAKLKEKFMQGGVQAWRNHNTPSSGFSSSTKSSAHNSSKDPSASSVSSRSIFQSASSNKSSLIDDFFDTDAPMMQPSQSTSQMKSKRSQSRRKPFFA